ncbi:MAG: alkaline phosphatase family protein, partial [Terriglobales bacterium]
MSNRNLLLSVDGLSPEQFQHIAQKFKLCKDWLEQRSLQHFDCGPFLTTQPIWAELLTGKRWFENGCVGYAQPSHSLNKLEVVSESRLQSPVSLIADGPDALCINVPLLEPKSRMWLADGSQPSLITVSPKSIAKTLNGSYKPRPYSSLVSALSNRFESAKRIIASDIEKLDAAEKLIATGSFTNALIRVSAFDHLQHFFGLSCFGESELSISPSVDKFIGRIDRFIAATAQAGWNVFVLSSYSHAKCRSRASLNTLLSSCGLQKLVEPGAQSLVPAGSSNRNTALAALTGSPPSAASLRSATGNFDERLTVAASPVAACIYINSACTTSDAKLAPAKERVE